MVCSSFKAELGYLRRRRGDCCPDLGDSTGSVEAVVATVETELAASIRHTDVTGIPFWCSCCIVWLSIWRGTRSF
jgi:hypothetical protein